MLFQEESRFDKFVFKINFIFTGEPNRRSEAKKKKPTQEPGGEISAGNSGKVK